MDWLKLLFGFLKEVIPTLTSFVVGRKSKELEQVKDENEKLKQFKKIDELKITKDKLANMDNWQ